MPPRVAEGNANRGYRLAGVSDLTDRLETFATVLEEQRHASTMAAGAWMDDPDDLGAFAAVVQGKLVELVIPDSYLTLQTDVLESIINAVIANAYLQWARTRQGGVQ